MTGAILLRCPKCGAESTSTRRGPHSPCVACAVERRETVQLMPASVPPDRIEPVHVQMLGDAYDLGAFKWDCSRAGHFFSDGRCGHCGLPAPEDPASAGEVRRLEAAMAAATETFVLGQLALIVLYLGYALAVVRWCGGAL